MDARLSRRGRVRDRRSTQLMRARPPLFFLIARPRSRLAWWYDDDDLRLGLGLGRRRSTEKRAQDARASDGAPIGASVTAIVAGCGAAGTLGLPLRQVR